VSKAQALPGASRSGPRVQTPPRGVRVSFAVVYGALAAVTVYAGQTEWMQLKTGLTHAIHPGTPPSPLSVLASLGAVVLAVLAVVRMVRGLPVPLTISGALLGSLALQIAALSLLEPRGRSADAGNLAVLEATQAFHRKMSSVLESQAEVPSELSAWQEAFAALKLPTGALRNRSFRSIPVQLVGGADGQAGGRPSRAGEIRVRWGEGGLSYELEPIGFDAALQPMSLLDADGRPITFKAAFNPFATQRKNAAPAPSPDPPTGQGPPAIPPR
jgi:hypothetical protein